MKYLLDTNICIYIIKRKPPEVIQRFKSLLPTEIGVSSITVAELEYGIYKSTDIAKNREALNQFLLPLEVLDFKVESTQAYGQLRADLSLRGLVIGAMDMLIAAQALSQDLVLVTNNTSEFSRISRLRLENWANR
jgi:tRNA(fMet)-specific endonuclease VapC